MKTLITLLGIVFFHFSYAQSISLGNINSSNILDFYEESEMLRTRISPSSVAISVQVGDGNIMEMTDKSPNYISLIQAGNYNTTYFQNTNNYPTQAEITVNGSGNYIDITGSNSISDGMKININTNDMTIFMRNY